MIGAQPGTKLVGNSQLHRLSAVDELCQWDHRLLSMSSTYSRVCSSALGESPGSLACHGLGVAPPPVQLVCADMLAQSASTSAMKAFSLVIAAIVEYVTMLTPDVLTNGS